MKKFIVAVLFLSASIVGTSIYTYPEATEALVTSTYNVSFQDLRYLPNGYIVQTVGVGLEQNALAYVASSINASVAVKPYKKTNSVFKSIRIIHRTQAYGFLGLNGLGRVANYSLTQDCNNQVCSIQKYRSELSAAVHLETGLTAEITFNDGVYTVTASKNRRPQ